MVKLSQRGDPWFRAGEAALAQAEKRRPIEGRAKNVILFIGDGLDVPTVTAARIYEGQLRGETGEENSLSFENAHAKAMAGDPGALREARIRAQQSVAQNLRAPTKTP